MSSATLTQFLIDVTRGSKKSDFAADREAVISSSALDDRLREAVRKTDIGTLWLSGAHPMALLYFARASGWSGEQYYACITAAQNSRN